MTKICAISDIHGNLIDNLIEPCDILCICGDILPLNIQRNLLASVAWLSGPFQTWALNQPCKHVIMIWGNHDFIGEHMLKYGFDSKDKNYEWLKGFTPRNMHDNLFLNDFENKLHILCNTEIEINGLNFYGTSWCPELKNWAFYASDDELSNCFGAIPDDVDILLTHCPPKFGTQGTVLQSTYNYLEDYGSQHLQDRLSEIKNLRRFNKPLYVLSGHIHSGNHNIESDGLINYVNVSLLDENYNVKYEPFYIEINGNDN